MSKNKRKRRKRKKRSKKESKVGLKVEENRLMITKKVWVGGAEED